MEGYGIYFNVHIIYTAQRPVGLTDYNVDVKTL